jgi:CubicO group peptidase (beta-lactamase class C family)/peptidoglycan/LPS O-acetylase OafA/YrhL
MSDTRDGFLDVVRALATIRVIIWHAFGAAAITFVAAMPAMFFVTGSLYARSADRHGARATFLDRVRRVGPSLWLFVAFAWIAMTLGAHLSGTDLHWRNLFLWLVPVADPTGSEWEGGWLATPLWYLRTLLWIFLLAPMIIGAARRHPLGLLLGGSIVTIVLELVDRSGAVGVAFPDDLVWQVGDVVLYGLFFAVGVLAHDGVLDRVRRDQWIVVAVVAAVVAGCWWFVRPVPEGIVNNSHPMHLFVGVAWLAVAMAARGVLRAASIHRWTSPGVRFLSQRSLTVYLWHTTAIVAALWFVNRSVDLPPGVWLGAYAVLIVAGTLLAVAAFGWLEDLGGRRPPKLWPATRPSRRRTHSWLPVAVPTAVIVIVALALPTASNQSVETAFRPRVPSQAPPVPRVVDADPVGPSEGEAVYQSSAELDHAALQALVDEWMVEFDIEGASASVATPGGSSFATAVGPRDDGEARQLGDHLDVMSVTKMFTANLVYRAADSGLLELDDPLPVLEAEPDFPYAGQLTARQLLSHRTGIVNFRDTNRYASDPQSVTSVSDAIASSVAEPLSMEPGSAPRYSSTNYLVLGRLLEQVTGVDYEELLSRELLIPLGLASASHLPTELGEPRYATAGLVADIGDLATAGIALLRDHVGISEAAYAAMFDIDVDTGMGPGMNGFCPCTLDPEGQVHWFGVGYTGGNTMLLYARDADVAIAIDVTGGLYRDLGAFDAVMELAERLATAIVMPRSTTGPV